MAGNRKRTEAKKKKTQGGGVFFTVLETLNPVANAQAAGHDLGQIGNQTVTPLQNVGSFVANPGGSVASGAKSFWINIIVNPLIGDFKKNRGKIVIGLVAGLVLVGAAVKIASGSDTVKTLGTASIAPEAEGLAAAKQNFTSQTATKLRARQPLGTSRRVTPKMKIREPELPKFEFPHHAATITDYRRA